MSVKSFMVNGKEVRCDSVYVNIVLGRGLGDTSAYEGFLLQSLWMT